MGKMQRVGRLILVVLSAFAIPSALADDFGKELDRIVRACSQWSASNYEGLINKQVCTAQGMSMAAAEKVPWVADAYLRYGREANYLADKYKALLNLTADFDQKKAVYELFQADLTHAFDALNDEVTRHR